MLVYLFSDPKTQFFEEANHNASQAVRPFLGPLTPIARCVLTCCLVGRLDFESTIIQTHPSESLT